MDAMEAPVAAASRSSAPLDLRAISRAAVVSALALVLPPIFHALHLGHVFLPMYLPILAGAFLLSPRWAAAVGVAAPLVSVVATGMPPLMPPIAVWMAVELGLMGGIAAVLYRRLHLPPWLIVPAVLVLGRVVYLGLVFVTAGWLGLPTRLLTLAALLSGWPGMVLAALVVPPAVQMARRWGAEA
jgi:hypothetical protein